MLNGIIVKVKPKDRVKLETIVADRNSPQKHVWRARIILLTADGCGTAAIMRGSGTSKTAVWRWQERFMTEGVAGLLRDKTRPGRLAPLGAQTEERVVRATLSGNMLFYNYMLMYAAAIRLRYSKPALARPFKVPGGTVGFAGVLFSFLVAFFPPDQLPVGSPSLYVGIVAGGTVIFCSIPLVLHAMRQADWTEAKQPAE